MNESQRFALNEARISVQELNEKKVAFFHNYSLKHPELTQQDIAYNFNISSTQLKEMLNE